MFKRISVVRRNLVGKDGGLGCGVDGVYKKKMVSEKERKKKRIKNRKGTKRTSREESEQCVFLYNIGLLGQAWIETFTHSFFNNKSFFLIFILGQGPLLSFDPLSYKFFDLSQSRTVQIHYSKWGWVARYFGPYTHTHTHTYIYIYNMLDLYWSHFGDSYWRKTNRTKT